MYILSQVLIIITYIFLAISYVLKNRKQILAVCVFSLICNALSYLFLSAWSGFVMCLVALTRNAIFLFQHKSDDNKKITKTDYVILFSLYLISIISAIFTYEGFFSLLSVMATMVYTFSVWQKNPKIYKVLGVPTSVLWICYNIFVKSIFGVILECCLLVCEVVGIIKSDKKDNSKKGLEGI